MVATETKRQTLERALAEVNEVLYMLDPKPKVLVDLASGRIEVTSPEYYPDETRALPAPDRPAAQSATPAPATPATPAAPSTPDQPAKAQAKPQPQPQKTGVAEPTKLQPRVPEPRVPTPSPPKPAVPEPKTKTNAKTDS
ncbi:hypothetical protein [Roseicitreum antarcticum]|nr:hypothetical protein [Roseicitreum antarcticum]